MANPYTGTTFSGIYKDDYNDSDGYHKILFNSGRHIQGRELNQLQTILQKQVSRMASNIFLDGAAVSPKSSGAGADVVDYIIVDSLNLTAGVLVSSYIGKTFKGPVKTGTLGVRFQISHVVDATGSDKPTLYGRYLSANQEGVSTEVQVNTPVFAEGEPMTADDGSGLASLSVYTQPSGSTISSIGKGCLFSMQSAEFYTQNHFVYAPKQTLAIGKYEGFVDAEVGFIVVQDIVTTADDDALYDNQGSRPNLSSPGADRYRIRMILAVRPEEGVDVDFVTFATVKNSVIIQIKEGTDNFNQIEKRLATRHADTHGNFIVNDFDLQFRNDDDSANMVYSLPAMAEGITPTAFLDGYHLEHQVPKEFRAPKPISFVTDSNGSMNVEYKNYVSFDGTNPTKRDSSLGFFGATNSCITNGKKLQLIDKTHQTIGYTRMKSIVARGTADSDAYRMHLYDTQMIGSGNFRDTHRISAWDNNPSNLSSGSRGAYPVQEEDNLYLQDPTSSTALFQIPGGRVKSIAPTEITVQRIAVTNVDVSNNITVTCGNDEDMIDKGQWIFFNDTQNVIDPISSGNIGDGTTTVTVTTTGALNDSISVYYYVQKNAPAAREKIYTVVTATATRTTPGDSAGDVFEFSNLYDGVELFSANATDASGADVTHLVEFDGGQRDNYYGPIVLRPDGIDASVTTISAEFAYFVHGTSGDFFSVNSYLLRKAEQATAANPIFGYEDIPDFKSRTSGDEYQLHNVMDFRPQLDPYANEMLASQSFEMPIDGAKINYVVDFYNHRIDHVALTYSDEFKAKLVVNKGVEAQQPVPPNEKANQMVLFDVMMSGKTKGVEDIGINRRTYRGYKMSDIHDITKRVAQLEETISLSVLENEASNLIEFGPEGIIRSKTGFFVDDFSQGYAFAASFLSNEFVDDASFATSSYDEGNNTMHARLGLEQVGFIHDADESVLPAGRRPAGNQTNIVVKGDNVMLDHIDVLDTSMKQEMISWKGGAATDYEEDGYYNVNPFNVFLGEGVLRLNPARDLWFDTRRLPDKQSPSVLIIRRVGEKLIPRTTTFSRTTVINSWSIFHREKILVPSAGPGWFRWGRRIGRKHITTTETQTFQTTQTVRNEVVSDQSVTRVIGDKRVAILSVPFMRQRRVYASAEGLRPHTRYWCFMDGIPMAQWVRNRMKDGWREDIRNNVHRRALSPSNVTYRRHPFVAGTADNVLLTNELGELFFELWVPNNARVSIPLSSQYNAVQEWTKWQSDSRRLSKEFGEKSAQKLDRCGWKFRAGTKVIKLLDISVDKEKDALSLARSTYTSSGQISIKQRTLQTTRTILFKNVLDTNEAELIGTTQDTTVKIVWRDPLAQSFTVDAGAGVPGVFVTKIEVFLHKTPRTIPRGGTDLAIPLELQIRGMTSGIPDANMISEQHRVFMTADSAYDATYKTIGGQAYDLDNHAKVLARPVTMKFKEPVYLRAGDEYAFVLLAQTDNYEAYVATTYDLVLGSNAKRVNKQPAMGSLFLSQNGSTWTPKQNQDMAFRIYTAKFKSEGRANFYSIPLEKFVHNSPQVMGVAEDSNGALRRIGVAHNNHGMGAGDLVSMQDLIPGTTKTVSHAIIQHASNEVSAPTSNTYFIDLNNYKQDVHGVANIDFNSRGLIGRDSVQTNRGFPVDRAMLQFQDVELERTGIQYAASFVSGLSHVQTSTADTNDPRFDIDNTLTPMANGESHFFSTPRYLGNADQEFLEIDTQGDSSPSVVVGATLFSEQISNFGQPTASQKSAGYVSDVSPYIDTQAIGMLVTNNIIDNQVMSDAEVPVLWTTNKPGIFAPETHPTLGTSPSKHITKIVQLSNFSSGLKIMVDMYVPPAASFDVYYRTGVAVDEDLYQNNWILAAKQNTPSKSVRVEDEDSMTFTEHRYLVGGETGTLPEFITFQVKVVFKSTNTCQSPVMESLRCIALAG